MKQILVGAALLAGAAAQDNLPDAKGRDELVSMCQGCHGLESIANMRETRRGWESLVNDMLGRGAAGTEEQVNLVIDYLAANFGKPVNVNKAASKQLQDALGIGAKEADSIVKYRQDHGDFKDLDALLAVPGVSAGKIRALSANIVF